MLPKSQQLIVDAMLLLKQKYRTKRAMSNVMAERLQKEADNFYHIFCRSVVNPEAITQRFIDSFYSVFQGELDSMKGKQNRQPVSSIELQHYEDLLSGLLKAIDNNTSLVAANHKLVEAQLLLLAKLPDP
jgi:hypothetical protein